MSFVSCEEVTVVKNEVEILKKINFNDDGQNVVIFGPSGSGKSTFLDLLAGNIFTTKGLFAKDKTKKVALVPRDYTFHKVISAGSQYYQQRYFSADSQNSPILEDVLQNTVLPIGTINLKSVVKPDPQYTHSELLAVCDLLNISHLLKQPLVTLSNGETRRSLLARVILTKPDVLLVDEPFAGLDTNSRHVLKEFFENISNTQFFIVDNQQTCTRNIGQFVKLENGILSTHQTYQNISYIPNDFKIEELGLARHTKHNTIVELKNGWVKYQKLVLSDVNWTVKNGDAWAVLGPNGSGKSSLLSLLTADNPQAYQNDLILFDKRRGSGESIWDIKKETGFVSPELQLYFNKATPVWKVMASGFFDSAGLFQKLTGEQAEKVNKFLMVFGLIDLKDRLLSQISTGQQRILFLARALIKNPSLLILDEPCQGLDHHQMCYFRNAVDAIVRSTGMTLIFVTHYADEIPSCVNNYLRLEKGRVVLS